MKRLILVIAAMASASPFLKAQELIIPDGYEVVDSVIVRPADALDTTLCGKSILSLMPESNVRISQSGDVKDAMNEHIKTNSDKKISGYRVRIYFDNRQDSRAESEAALDKFQRVFPGVAAYRNFANPFFKVTVGDFRTKSEASQFHQMVVRDFPTAFVVKEYINYPVVDKENATIIDTVLILKPKNAVTSEVTSL